MPNMASVIEIMFELLHRETKLPQKRERQIIVEEIIEHYLSSSVRNYDENNKKWILSVINCQNHFTSLNCVLPIKAEAKYFKVINYLNKTKIIFF